MRAKSGLQHVLNDSAAACDTAGMKISISKTVEVLHLSRNLVQCFLRVGGASLKQVEKLKCLGVGFTSNGRQGEELDVRLDKASAFLHHSVVL